MKAKFGSVISIFKQNKMYPVLIGVLIFPFIMSKIGVTYPLYVACYMQIYIIAVSGIDILFGYSGQISMGHAGFYAIGAYGSALLHNNLGIPIILSMIIATLVAGFLGALLAYPASRLVFHFLALATIAFGEIIYQLISHSPNNFTGNFTGLFTEKLSLFGFKIDSYFKYYFFGLVCVIIFLIMKNRIIKSRVGRALIAIRENTHAADGMGINVRKYKIIAFMLSAIFTAFAGAMYAHFIGYVSPDTFMQKQSILFMTILLFGGTASIMGPIIGVVVVLLLTESLRIFQDYQMILYGALILIVILALPGGLYGSLKDILLKIKRKVKKESEEETIANS